MCIICLNFKTGIATLVVICGLIFSACTQPVSNRNYAFPQAQSLLGTEQSVLLTHILADYLHLKDALVATNAGDADKWSTEMKSSIVLWQQQLSDSATAVTGATAYPVLRQETDSMLLQLNAMINAKNKDCELKRIHFKALSDLIYIIIEKIDMRGILAYRHYCPMAMNEKGAYWLSASPDIENPYFGQKMLTCGELVDTLR
ncbi:MAG: DUF3347 domain-containing protein [Moraxellaceae bacterium]|nr:MAG: DUF3347 domain-containing protein [Moraxellaceae bacterium]